MTIRIVTLALIFSFTGALMAAEESADGHAAEKPARSVEELTATCIACHGEKGISMLPINPNLAGQHRDYLLISMQRYRDGKRQNAVMAGMVAGMSDEELASLAEYYAAQDGLRDTASRRFK